MRLSLTVLLLGAKGGLAQSREPAKCPNYLEANGGNRNDTCPWDGLVSNFASTCTKDSTAYTCNDTKCTSSNFINVDTTSQTGPATATVNFNTDSDSPDFKIKAFYVTDQYGTIIDYHDNDGNTVIGNNVIGMTFTITESIAPPTAVVPHILVEGTCEDLRPSAPMPTWLGSIQAKMEEYDVSGSGYGTTGNFTTFDSGADTFTATFPSGPDGDNIAWVEDQNGNILYFEDGKEATASWAHTGEPVDDAMALTACRLFETERVCSTVDLMPIRIEAVKKLGMAAGAVELTVTKTKAYNKPEKVSLALKNAGECSDGFLLWAEAAGETLAAALNKAIEFVASEDALSGTTFEWNVMCSTEDTSTLTTETVDMANIPVSTRSATKCNAANDPIFCAAPTEVGSPQCNVSGTTEDEANDDGDYNVTVDGRSCTCSKGDLFCLKSTDGLGDYWSLSDGEAIGIALTVSVIVLILIMGLIFICLQKTTKSTEIVSTLKANTAEGDDNKL